jgi:alpha-L-arabinofuranosidase
MSRIFLSTPSVSSSYDPVTGSNVVFIVNRSLTDDVPVTLQWQDQQPSSIKAAYQLAGNDPKAVNSFENPNTITTKSIAAPAVQAGWTRAAGAAAAVVYRRRGHPVSEVSSFSGKAQTL